MIRPPGATGRQVIRFTASERVLHWTFALTYLGVAASGLPIMFPGVQGWIRDYNPAVGMRLHLATAVLWIVATALVVVAADRPRLRVTLRQLSRLGAADGRWLARFPHWLVAGRAARARLDAGVGRFNAGQKANALFTVASAAALAVTGLGLLPVGGGVLADRLTGPASAGWWREAHGWLTIAAMTAIAGHVLLATVYGPTRGALSGMLDGRVDADWAAEHHPCWRPDPAEARAPSSTQEAA